MIDFAQHPRYLHWAEEQLGQSFSGIPAAWLTSIDQTGSILGVVIFSRFTTANCEITVASSSPRFLSRRLIQAAAVYAFIQMEKRRVTAFIAVGNDKSLSLAQRLGFRVEGIAKSWFPASDAYILGLTREECKWLKDFHGLS
jgi:RimJ/RimL family protein N-acetyltransferase